MGAIFSNYEGVTSSWFFHDSDGAARPSCFLWEMGESGKVHVPHKYGLEPLKNIEPLNGVIFTLPTNKMLNFSQIDNSYMEKEVVLGSLA